MHEERVYDRENRIYYDVHSKNDRYVWPKPHKKHNKNFFFIFFSGQRAFTFCYFCTHRIALCGSIVVAPIDTQETRSMR